MAKLVSKEQLKQFMKDNHVTTMQDVQSMLKEVFTETLQEMFEAELDHELGYAKHDVKRKRTANS